VSNYLETINVELQLSVNINRVRNFAKGLSDEQHIAFLQSSLEIYFLRVLYKQCALRFIISRLKVDLTRKQILLTLFIISIPAELITVVLIRLT